LNEWQFTMPADAVERVQITHLYIFNNHLFRESSEIFQPDNGGAKPEIIVEQYRKTLTPGGKETFTVSVKTKNENTAAELMTTMYDASLDKLEKHEWELPREKNNDFRIESGWDYSISSMLFYQLYEKTEDLPSPHGHAPLWWLDIDAINTQRAPRRRPRRFRWRSSGRRRPSTLRCLCAADVSLPSLKDPLPSVSEGARC